MSDLERLIAMSERLAAALEADIAVLERGKPAEMRAIGPEIQQLSANFLREAQALSPAIAKAAPAAQRARFTQSTKRFREALKLHARILTRVKNASEGMIRAVAAEIERQTVPARTYAPAVARKTATNALLYNNVI